MTDCLFCGIVAGDVPAEIVHETERTVAFRDINPVAPVHVLVVPRRHIDNAAARRRPSDADDLAAAHDRGPRGGRGRGHRRGRTGATGWSSTSGRTRSTRCPTSTCTSSAAAPMAGRSGEPGPAPGRAAGRAAAASRPGAPRRDRWSRTTT